MSRALRGVVSASLRSPAATFALALYVALGLNLIQGVLFARILGPADYGIWLSLLLLFQYGQHYHLGVINSVNRQLPLLQGRDEPERALRVAAAAKGLMLLTAGGWLVLGLGITAALYRTTVLGAVVVVVVTALEGWVLLAQTELKTARRFGVVGLLTVVRHAANLGLLVLVLRFGLEGAYLRWVVLVLALFAWSWKVNPVRARWDFSRAEMGGLLADGGPILVVGVLFSLQTSLDRTLLFLLRDTETMGSYGVAAILMSVMMVIPGAVGQTSYPRMLEQFGRDGLASDLWPAVRSRTLKVAALSASAATLGAFLLPWAVRWLLPSFVEGVRAAQWLLPGAVFVAASVPASYYLQTIRRQRQHAVLSAIALGVQLVLGVTVLGHGHGIVALAMATSAGLGGYATLLLVAAARHGRPQPG